MRDSFRTGRVVIGVVEVLGWGVVATGLTVVGFVAMSPHPDGATLLTGVALTIGGLVQVAVVQIARAQIATAENTSELVRLIAAPPAPSASGPAATLGSGRGTVVKHHHGQTILRDGQAFVVGENVFPSVIAAERWIDGR